MDKHCTFRRSLSFSTFSLRMVFSATNEESSKLEAGDD